jgi:hypothetical protein
MEARGRLSRLYLPMPFNGHFLCEHCVSFVTPAEILTAQIAKILAKCTKNKMNNDWHCAVYFPNPTFSDALTNQ